jgi:AcrR family transcriptional regulator
MRAAIRPRKKPSQARAADTVEMILTAAARVLATHSLAGFNTNRVAALAGVSVGSLYQYFPNKDALVAVLIARRKNWRLTFNRQYSDTCTLLLKKRSAN